MSTKINLDDATPLDIEAHESLICQIVFELSGESAWSPEGTIKVGSSYDYAPTKTYTVGNGLTISGQDLIWNFNPTDWGNQEVVYDASVVRVANQQRDFKGKITINKSFN